MSKLNININRDETGVNDYLYCWSEFDQRPNKITLYNHYSPELFMEVLEEFKIVYCGTTTDIIPTGEDRLVNERSLVKINDGVYISFSQFDKLTDGKIIGDIIFFYTTDYAEVINNQIMPKLDQASVGYSDADSQEKFNTLYIGQEGLEIEPITLLPTDYDNIDLYYNTSVIKGSKKTIRDIKKNNKGLSMIFGPRGNGKTNLINYIVSNTDKLVIFIPSTMIEHTINSPDFLPLIRRHRNSIIVIDDCEMLFTDIYRKSTLFVNNLLQLIDGYQSDIFSANIIVSMNIKLEDLTDRTLLESNSLLNIIEVDKLDTDKAIDLSSHLGHKSKSIKSKMRVIDVVNKDWLKNTKVDFGFN